jgi:hypothetical protein
MLAKTLGSVQEVHARAIVLLVTLFGLSGRYYQPCSKSALRFNTSYSAGYLKNDDLGDSQRRAAASKHRRRNRPTWSVCGKA